MAEKKRKPAKGKKGLKWKDLMKLSVDEIKEFYPQGAIEDETWRWWPGVVHVDGIGRRPLADLLKSKRVEVEKARLLHRNPSAVGEGRAADEDEELGYTDLPHLALDAGEAPPADIVNDQSKESQARYEVIHAEDLRRRTMKSRIEQIRQLAKAHIAKGQDPTPYLDRALDELKKAA